ncbi:MAG: ribosome recycling factor [Clostridia bacterium]|nr:ribosome recycling factor [Clostridia bacterium]
MKFEIKEYEAKMQKSVSVYESNLSSIRASQANAAVLSRVSFDYYGVDTPVNTMADIRVSDAKTLTITPYDAKTIKDITKAIMTSDIGITPSNDGKVIRLVFPQLTEERRKEIAKQVQKMCEDAKVNVRNIRREANDAAKKMKKDNLLTEDEEKDSEKKIQELTDKFVKMIDEIAAKKDKEILSL